MATAYSPTAGRPVLKVAAGSSMSASTLITARSVRGSRPSTVAGSFSPVVRVTSMLPTRSPALSVTTWLLVMIVPSAE